MTQDHHHNELQALPEVFPVCYFAPVHWYARWIASPNPIIEVHSWYQKQQLSSRCWIDHPGGPVALSIPVERRSKKAPISEKGVSYQENWPAKHFRSLQNTYNNSPYFHLFEDSLETHFHQRYDTLLEWLIASHELVIRLCRFTQHTRWSTTYVEPEELSKDWRNHFSGGLPQGPDIEGLSEYPQLFGNIHKGLSILDLLFMTGPEAFLYLNNHENKR